MPEEQPPQQPFSFSKNQREAVAGGAVTGVAAWLSHVVTAIWDKKADGIPAPSEDLLIVVFGIAFGYVALGARDIWKYLGWPLFRQWYKKRFGVEPEQEGE